MKYIQNAAGGVLAVTDEHATKYLTVHDDAGNEQPKLGYKFLTEKQAQAANPQLFGLADPQVTYTPAEIVARRKYAEDLAAFKAADAAVNTAAAAADAAAK